MFFEICIKKNMSSILRSSKFVRCFAGFARGFVLNSRKIEVEGSLFANTTLEQSNFIRSLSFQAVNSQSRQNSNSLEKTIQQLDQDVRRTGRISRRDIEEVLEEIRHSRAATSSQSLLIIRCCGSLVPEELPSVRTELVQQIWNTLEKLKVPMDISHYNALLRVYLENEHSFSPTKFLMELEKKGIEPNRVTYQRLITRYCQDGDIEGATKILEYMREKSLPVNENVFNSLIMGHSQADDMESARGILSVMKQAGLEPSADTYTTLMCGYAKRGEMDQINGLIKECEDKEIYLLDKDYFDVIYSLAINGHLQYIDDMMGRMKKSIGYNQDAVNLILRLVNHGLEDISLKILLSMTRSTKTDGTLAASGSFFIKQLLKADVPVEKVFEICKFLEKEGLNSRALNIAAEASLTKNNVEHACDLFKMLKSEGLPIRQHYFWPFLCTAGKSKNKMESVKKVISLMINEFDLLPNLETLREYIIPNFTKGKYDEVVGMLKSVGVPPASVAVGIVHELLYQSDLAGAADVASKYRAYYAPNMLKKPLMNAFSKTKDTKSFVTLLHNIHDGLDRQKLVQDDVEDSIDKREMIGQFVYDAVKTLGGGHSQLVKEMLEDLLTRGLGLTHSTAEKIQNVLSGQELTNEISSLLDSLTSSDLTTTPVVKKAISSSVNFVQYDETTLLRKIKLVEDSNQSSFMLKKTLLAVYCKEQNIEKAENLFKSGEWLTGSYANMIEMYVRSEDADKALQCLNELESKHMDAVLSSAKRLKLATLLVKSGRLDEAFFVLDKLSLAERDDETSASSVTFAVTSATFQLLNTLAEQGKTEEIKRAFDLVVKNELCPVTNVILGPLIKVHLVNNDVDSAMNEFEKLCTTYKFTPWKNELSCKLIELEDAKSLQRLTDLSTRVHGEVNSLYDLVFSFVQCGRIRQARRILETPGLRSKPQRLASICEKYRQSGAVETLEGLVEATRDMTHIDRSDIFMNLLLTYVEKNNVEKSLGVWTQMQEEDVQPSDEFLIKLGKFLQQQGQEVPFVIPEDKTVKTPTVRASASEKIVQEPSLNNSELMKLKTLRAACRGRDHNKVVEIVRRLQSENVQLSSQDLSYYVEALCHLGELSEAVNVVSGVLESNQMILTRHLSFLLNKLSLAGDVEPFDRFENFLSSEHKRVLSFDNRRCSAYLASGRVKEYFDRLESELEAANTEKELSLLDERFPRGGATGVLVRAPENLIRLEMLAKKFNEKGIVSPYNVLWQHCFIEPELRDKADKIFKQYLSNTPRVMFKRILNEARLNKDVELVNRLLDCLSESKVNEAGLGVAYSCLLDVLVTQEKVDEGLKSLKQALEKISLEHLNRSALTRLKTLTESQGKEFPYTVPEKTPTTPLLPRPRANRHASTRDLHTSCSLALDSKDKPLSAEGNEAVGVREKRDDVRSRMVQVPIDTQQQENMAARPAEEKEKEEEGHDELLTSMIGFRSSFLNVKHNNDWRRFLKDEHNVLGSSEESLRNRLSVNSNEKQQQQQQTLLDFSCLKLNEGGVVDGHNSKHKSLIIPDLEEYGDADVTAPREVKKSKQESSSSSSDDDIETPNK